MANWFTYNGISSASFGLFVSGSNTFVHPERDRSIIEVPGRDGDVVIDNGRYKDVTITYDVFCNDRSKFDSIANWLLVPISKCQITDTYQPLYYRTGIFVGDIQWSMGQLNRNGRCSLSFRCNPLKYRINSQWITNYTNPSPGVYQITYTQMSEQIQIPIVEVEYSTIGYEITPIMIPGTYQQGQLPTTYVSTTASKWTSNETSLDAGFRSIQGTNIVQITTVDTISSFKVKSEEGVL